jgi:hypothetical protein
MANNVAVQSQDPGQGDLFQILRDAEQRLRSAAESQALVKTTENNALALPKSR